MQPFVARKTVGGKKVCEGCARLPMTGRTAGFKNLAALDNPAPKNGKHPQEWFHGSPHDFDHFNDPADFYDQNYEEDTDRYGHWNTLLGSHFTADHRVAKDFSGGDHTHSDDMPDDPDDQGPLGHVIHVKLHLKNPKVYASEHDMDQEVYEHEWENGNRISKHIGSPPEDDDAYDKWADDAQSRRIYADDAERKYGPDVRDPGFAHGFHPKATGWLNVHPDKEGIAQRYKERMKRAGYDGVVYGNTYEGGGKSAIAFEPHQIEITQHHYGKQECLDPEEAKRRAVHPDQQVLPGLDDVQRKLPKERQIDFSKHWPTTWTPSFFHGRTAARAPESHDTGRLWAPLPQECWDRYYGRHTGAQRRTGKTWTMKYLTYAPEGGYVDKETEVEGPFFHGSRSKRLAEGTHITPGRKTNPWGDEGAKSQHVFFTTEMRTAADYAQQAGGHVYEVEPTGDFSTDYSSGDYKTKQPLRVIRKLDHSEWSPTHKEASIGEESARQHAGQQDVYAVRSGNGMTNMCRYHAETHVTNRQAADDLGEQAGLTSRERSAEMLGEARKGRCSVCEKGTPEQLKMMSPLWVRNADAATARGDRSRPARRKDKPLKTKPLPSLRQSENIRWASRGDVFHADTGYRGGVRFHPDGTPRHLGDHTVPAGAEVHDNEHEAWNKAIEHWNAGRSDFPRVYVVHQPKVEGGKLTHEADASELDYDHEKHPALRSVNEEPHEPIMFHGTSKHEDDESPEEITASGGAQSFGPGIADPDYAYATPSLTDAWSYAHKRVENGHSGKPTVYRVTPHKPEDVEKDPTWAGDYSRGNNEHDKRSKSGFEVLDEVPMSEKQEHDWRESPYNDEAENEDYGDEDDHHYAARRSRKPGPGQLPLLSDEELGIKPKVEIPKGPLANRYNFVKRPDQRNHWYHGGAGDLDLSRQTGQIGDTTHWNTALGPHFAGNEKLAAGFASGETGKEVGRVTHAELHISNPKVYKHEYDMDNEVLKDEMERGTIPDNEENRFWSRVRSGKSMAMLSTHPDATGIAKRFKDKLKKRGYDGIVYKNAIETGQGMCAVPFEHDQINVIQSHDFDPAKKRKGAGNPYQCNRQERTAMSKLPTLRMLAHDATENQALRHCPFCGAGKIIGRADGSVECEFCHSYFTVQVQPQYPNFPQTINGMPQQIPGMPGQVEQPAGAPGMDPGGLPPGAEGEDAGGGPPWAQDGAEGDPDDDAEDKEAEEEPPPFAKQSAFQTVAGAWLTEDDYVRHLAIRHAPDRGAMIARIREERGGE